jgi:hypothetical protein
MITLNQYAQALEQYEQKIKTLSPEALKKLTDAVKDLTPSELCRYQELKSIAQVENKISLDVAMSIYNALSSWTHARLSEKILITQLMARWLGAI